VNARLHGEEEIVAIALPAAPCGHCRQFMHETGADIKIIVPSNPPSPSPFLEIPLSKLLPMPFGPGDLGIEGRLLTRPPEFHSSHADPLIAKAIVAAHDSYAPYSRSPAGVAILTKQGKIYTGSNLDNAAYNPSLAPLQCALVALIADSGNYEDITQVVLVEKSDREISHRGSSQDLLSTIAPQAEFKHITLDSFQ
jgi:cytidine deaminase